MSHYDPTRHRRRSIRLRVHDYARGGVYFVTLITHHRAKLFGRVVDGSMQLSPFGQIALRIWNELPGHYQHVRADAFVVMPDHLHFVVMIGRRRRTRRPSPDRGLDGHCGVSADRTDPTAADWRTGVSAQPPEPTAADGRAGVSAGVSINRDPTVVSAGVSMNPDPTVVSAGVSINRDPTVAGVSINREPTVRARFIEPLAIDKADRTTAHRRTAGAIDQTDRTDAGAIDKADRTTAGAIDPADRTTADRPAGVSGVSIHRDPTVRARFIEPLAIDRTDRTATDRTDAGAIDQADRTTAHRRAAGAIDQTDRTDAHRHAGARSSESLTVVSRRPTLGEIVRAYKARVSIAINRARNTPGKAVWQRNYYERIVRDRRALRAVRRYILANPAQWEAKRKRRRLQRQQR